MVFRSLLHSEEVYGDDVDKFKPERFMKPDAKYPDSAFGFGRRLVRSGVGLNIIVEYKYAHRACPGRHLADNILFIMIASILYTFNISPYETSSGPELPDVDAFVPGIISYVC